MMMLAWCCLDATPECVSGVRLLTYSRKSRIWLQRPIFFPIRQKDLDLNLCHLLAMWP